MKRIIFKIYIILLMSFIAVTTSVWGQTAITFDISKGNVLLTDSNYSGKGSNGETISGSHDPANIYTVTGTTTEYYIRVGDSGEANFATKNFIIYLNGVNIQRGGKEGCAFGVYNKDESVVAVILKDNTNNILYSGYNRAGLEKSGGAAADGTLVITCEEGYTAWKADNTHGHTTGEHNESACTTSCGYLDARSGRAWQEVSANTYYHAGAGIGTSGEGTGGSNKPDEIAGNNALVNLTIAGGNITAAGTWGNTGGSSGGGASIGTGCAITSSAVGGTTSGLKITGGNIKAYRLDNSAACIGGGYRSGYVTMDIYGGTITANEILESNGNTVLQMRAAAIGGGGGGTGSASPAGATVRIHNGKITASGHYGSAIGSGAGGSSGHGQNAVIIIDNGHITATTTKGNGNGSGAAIGAGGSLSSGYAGNANITINGGKIIATSELGSDIGGGGTNSGNTGDYGGEGIIAITGGDITANTGGIGGGRANKGVGGNAEINISGETTTITAKSIGGGRSKTNTGGNVKLTVNGGKLNVTDFIGGGIGGSDLIGWAKVYINGGTISGRTVMKASTTDGCVFEMSGGTLTSPITNDAGGAVYMIDPNGIATLSGGTIQNCKGTTGGAVYMTGGTFTISGGNMTNNTATQNGAAVYLAGTGKVIVNGGTITGTEGQNFSAIYMSGGEFTMSGGTIKNFRGTNSGAVFMQNGTFTMTDGTIDNCNGTGSGAIYMSGGTFEISGGTISNCTGAENGGAVYLGGTGTVNVNGGNFTGNSVTANGGAIYMAGGNFTMAKGNIGQCSSAKGGAVYMTGGNFTISGTGIMTNNSASQNGAAVYLAGTGKVFVNGGNITGTADQNVEAIYMEDGEFTMTAGTIENFKGVNSGALYMQDGTFTMTNGNIYNCSGTGSGAIYMSGGKFEISGGKISNCSGADGGALYMADGTFSISGNAVMQGNSSTNGGAVYLAGNGTLNINGGTIINNQATSDGGAIYLTAGTFNMTDGKVESNTSKGGNGAGIYINNGTVSLTGGDVTGNEATEGKGGGFYVGGGNVTLSNGTISSNKANTAGGGICLEGTTSTVSMTVSGCTLTENEATDGNGGGIFLSNAEMTYNGGLLTLNNASGTTAQTTGKDASDIKGVGGGIYISSNSKLTFGDFSKLGVYANTAEVAADDLFANGNGTSLLLPNIANMSLQNYAGNADGLGWYEDYFVGDSEYNTQKIAKGDKTKENFDYRFRKAQELGSSYMRLYDFEPESVQLDNYYVSLALGFLFSDLTIRIEGLTSGESCVFSVQGTAENGKYKYQVPVYGTTAPYDEQKIVKLPVDKYTVTIMQMWPWAYKDPTVKTITKMNSLDGGIYHFNVEHKETAITHEEKNISIKLD